MFSKKKIVFDEFDTNPWQDEQRQGAGIRPHHRLGGIGRWRRTCVQLTGQRVMFQTMMMMMFEVFIGMDESISGGEIIGYT